MCTKCGSTRTPERDVAEIPKWANWPEDSYMAIGPPTKVKVVIDCSTVDGGQVGRDGMQVATR